MENNKTKYGFLVLHIFIFLSFLGFIYFSYFTAKELLVLRNITPKDHANKFYFWEINDCNNINSYPNNYAYLEASQENEGKISDEKEKEIIKECNTKILERSESMLLADFKYNFIKYGLATLFFFILFMFGAIQNMFIYKKYSCTKNK